MAAEGLRNNNNSAPAGNPTPNNPNHQTHKLLGGGETHNGFGGVLIRRNKNENA